MWHPVTRKPPTELGESLKISARFLFFRFIYNYQYVAHSTNDISTIHFLINLLKSSFLLRNKTTKSRAGSCTHFKWFNDFQSIFGVARNSNDITDKQEQWSIWEGKKSFVHSSKAKYSSWALQESMLPRLNSLDKELERNFI